MEKEEILKNLIKILTTWPDSISEEDSKNIADLGLECLNYLLSTTYNKRSLGLIIGISPMSISRYHKKDWPIRAKKNIFIFLISLSYIQRRAY